jgi:signal transduction histidine kinase
MFEHRIIRRDGEVRHIVVRIAITKDEQGRTVKTHGANQDITDRKRMEESLRQANRKLGLLTGITRHDIKNQLFALKAFLSIASDKTSDAATVRDSLVHALQAADIIEEQIAFTKEYELIGSENPIWQNPSAVLDATLREVHMDGVVITNSLHPSLEVYSDPMLRKVLFNLLDNALRHGERVSKIQVSARSHGDDLLIVWEDNGVGIAHDDKDLIFERGFGKNSGLGMFLAREILSLTGITIRETGEPGRGARFEIRVPRGVHRTAGRA